MLSGAACARDDFDRLLALALATHPAVEGRRAGLEAARADREGSEWQQYPTPSFEMATRNSGSNSAGGNNGVFALEQPLWTGGRITAGIRAAGFRETAAEAAVVEARLTTGLRVIAAYTEVLRQVQRRDYSRAAVDEHDRLFALIGRRVQQEVSPPADRDFAQARLSQAATDLSVSVQALQIAEAQLSQLVGRPVQELEDVRLEGRTIPTTLNEALSRAIERSPVLARLEQVALAAGEDINAKRAVIMPQLMFRFEKQFGVLSDNRAMLVLRAQPGAGLSAASGVAAAQRRLDEARSAGDEARRAVREQVQTAFAEWQASQVRLASTQRATGMTQAVFESYTRQYVTGRKTWIDVLNAVREVNQSQLTLADAEALARASALRLWILSGEVPLGDGIIEGKS
jgi:adhesin transport system outer membrane protein